MQIIGEASFIFHYSWSHQGRLLSSLARGGLGAYLVPPLWSRARTQMNKRRSWRNIEMLLLWEFEFRFGQKTERVGKGSRVQSFKHLVRTAKRAGRRERKVEVTTRTQLTTDQLKTRTIFHPGANRRLPGISRSIAAKGGRCCRSPARSSTHSSGTWLHALAVKIDLGNSVSSSLWICLQPFTPLQLVGSGAHGSIGPRTCSAMCA
jgi:hypothetical protein